jgi:hypothetical protein
VKRFLESRNRQEAKRNESRNDCLKASFTERKISSSFSRMNLIKKPKMEKVPINAINNDV